MAALGNGLIRPPLLLQQHIAQMIGAHEHRQGKRDERKADHHKRAEEHTRNIGDDPEGQHKHVYGTYSVKDD